MMKKILIFSLLSFTLIASLIANAAQPRLQTSLWQVYQQSLESAKYVDLTHTITPSMPVWEGFAAPKFEATVNPKTGTPYTYKKDGFEATHYNLPTDQLGTQLDPPAHWNPDYPAIAEPALSRSCNFPQIIVS